MTDSAPDQVVQANLQIMSPAGQLRAICALLFVASEPVTLSALARHLGCTVAESRVLLERASAALGSLGLALQWVDTDHVQIGTAPDLATIIRQFLGQERTFRLSQAALETVAVIAYRQPVTRADIESVRGVDSSGVLQTLLARGLIEPVGRLPTVGTPLLYATTPEFLRLFGLGSLEEMPTLPDDLVNLIDDRLVVDGVEEPESSEA
ncbi:MAG: SMC-Scp complex subunit ScpB [Nitrolancea sp.]